MFTRLETTISMQLEVMPNNKVLVPGCEPTSALSSTTLSSWLAAGGCDNVMVDLDKVLDAIPGAFVKLGTNFGRGNIRQKWLVLPPIDTDCPCAKVTDWYSILQELADDEPPVEEVFDACNLNGMGYCPSPDFDSTPEPPSDPYKPEGSFPADVGVLPPIPPWSTSGT